MTRVQHEVPTTVGKVLDFSREALVSCGELQKSWSTLKGESTKDVEGCEVLEAELHEARLKLKLMKD